MVGYLCRTNRALSRGTDIIVLSLHEGNQVDVLCKINGYRRDYTFSQYDSLRTNARFLLPKVPGR